MTNLNSVIVEQFPLLTFPQNIDQNQCLVETRSTVPEARLKIADISVLKPTIKDGTVGHDHVFRPHVLRFSAESIGCCQASYGWLL